MYTPTFRTNRANVPVLSKKEIDDIGEGLVADFCPQALESREVNVFSDKMLSTT